jgi:hypothetical protein
VGHLRANRDAIAARLTAAGVERVTTDPRNVSPPCVLVGLPQRLTRAGCGLEGVIPVHEIAAGPGNADAVGWLLDTAEQVAAVVPCSSVEPGSYSPDPGAPGTLPAYVATTAINTAPPRP